MSKKDTFSRAILMVRVFCPAVQPTEYDIIPRNKRNLQTSTRNRPATFSHEKNKAWFRNYDT